MKHYFSMTSSNTASTLRCTSLRPNWNSKLIWIWIFPVLSYAARVSGRGLLPPAPEKRDMAAMILNRILDEEDPGYDRDELPFLPLAEAKPRPVNLSLYIRNINSFDDVKQEIGAQLTLRLYWRDERHRYEFRNSSTDGTNVTEKSSVSSLPEFISFANADRIWYPDIYIMNEKSGFTHNILQPNILVRIFKNGTTLMSVRVTIVVFCPMRVHWYPFDRHRCEFKFASYSQVAEELVLLWRETDPLQVSPQIQLSMFVFGRHEFHNGTYQTNTGSYSAASIQIEFSRRISYYVVNAFIPCYLLVIISWMSFWFDVSATDARVSLGITTVLTMATLTYSLSLTAPPASYSKAMDIFMGGCQLIVVLALLEFVIVDITMRSEMRKSSKEYFNMIGIRLRQYFGRKDSVQPFSNDEDPFVPDRARQKAKQIDLISRIIFPSFGLGFSAVYFCVCFFHNH